MIELIKITFWYLAIFLASTIIAGYSWYNPSQASMSVASNLMLGNQEVPLPPPPTEIETIKPKIRRIKNRWQNSRRFLTKFNKDKAFNGCTLLPISGTAEVLLLDMRGNLLHKWDVDASRARLLPNKNLLVVHTSSWGKGVAKWRKLENVITEYNWKGKQIWSYSADKAIHHDARRLKNGNTVFLKESFIPEEFKDRILSVRRRKVKILADSVVEVNQAGKIAWQWNSYENLDLNFCGIRSCDQKIKNNSRFMDPRDWTHMNTMQVLPENRWYDRGDKRFKPGNILILPRNWWTPLIIDRETGKVVWKYERRDYRGGLGAPHESAMIPKGYPGGGNILIFDNGPSVHPRESFILEINPQTKKIEWVYDAGKSFFSKTRGSVQRLKNGNTLISADRAGRLFEVTKQHEVVWDFRVPQQLSRGTRYSAEFCAGLPIT